MYASGIHLTLSSYAATMDFALIVTAGILALILILVGIGRWYPGSGADVLDWKPTRSYEDEVRLELEDIDQMLEAQNERRRRSGRPELTEDEIRAQVDAAQRELKERGEVYRGGDAPSRRGPGSDCWPRLPRPGAGGRADGGGQHRARHEP